MNLDGVLVTLHKLDEAMDHNVRAVITRPGDALANSQLGMVYCEPGQFDQAVRYLECARQADPARFSHPQLFLAEIHLQRGDKREAADVMQDFLNRHPDYPPVTSAVTSTVANFLSAMSELIPLRKQGATRLTSAPQAA